MSHQEILSHRHSIKMIYEKTVLSRIVTWAQTLPNTQAGDAQFVSFQRDILQHAFSAFKYDVCTINFIEATNRNVVIDDSTVCFGVSRELLDDYETGDFIDPLAPLVFANAGRLVSLSMIMPWSEFKAHSYFKNYLSKFGIIDGAAIGFLLPAHHHSFIMFGYGVFENAYEWQQFDHTRLELASFPFLLAWLFRKGLIDLVELERRFLLLEGWTESQIQNLRKFVNSPHQDFKEQALDLGIKPGTLKDDLYNTRDILLSRIHDSTRLPKEKTRGAMRELEHHCNFLTLLGDHTQSILKPTR